MKRSILFFNVVMVCLGFGCSKTNLKLIKIRMDKINKRRNSVQKFFRADIADLLKNNLDINAYGRVFISSFSVFN